GAGRALAAPGGDQPAPRGAQRRVRARGRREPPRQLPLGRAERGAAGAGRHPRAVPARRGARRHALRRARHRRAEGALSVARAVARADRRRARHQADVRPAGAAQPAQDLPAPLAAGGGPPAGDSPTGQLAACYALRRPPVFRSRSPQRPVLLSPDAPPVFPDPRRGDDEGLVAIGGDLSVARLRAAYAAGIFPWYNDGFPALWWSPTPRAILPAADLRGSPSLPRRPAHKDYVLPRDL